VKDQSDKKASHWLADQNLGSTEGWLSVFLNTFLFFLKYWVGMASGSVAMMADAWHTLSDTLTSVVVLVGFWIKKMPPDKEHPFGHGRAESVASVVIATLLMVVGFSFLRDSVQRLINYQAAAFTTVALLVFLVSTLLKELLARFSLWAGKKINAYSLIADAWHHRSDAIASLLIVVGAYFGRYVWWIDGALGIAVSVVILYTAIELLLQATSIIMGIEPSQELRENIVAIARQVCDDEIQDVHHLHVHQYGDHVEVTFHIRVDPNTTVHEAHDMASKIEQAVREKLHIEATVHVEPEYSAS